MARNYVSLAEEVKTLGVPRKELSILTGISYNTISHWINGFSNLTEANMQRLTDAIMVYRNKMTKQAFEKKYNRIHTISI